MITEGKKVRVRLSVDKEALKSECVENTETIQIRQRVELLEKIESIAMAPDAPGEAERPTCPAESVSGGIVQLSGIEKALCRQSLSGKLSSLYCERILAFSSPHSVAVYQINQEEGNAFIVTECPPGAALADFARNGRKLSVENILQVFTQVAEALAAAHESGLFHGALDAESIFVSEGEGGHLYVKVTGLGFRQLSEDLPTFTKWLDVRALGRLLFEFLSGEKLAQEGESKISLPDLPQSPFANLTNCPVLVRARHSALIKIQLQFFISSLLKAGEGFDIPATFAVKRLVELEQNYSRPTPTFLFTARLAELGKKMTRKQEKAIVAGSIVAAMIFIVLQSVNGLVVRERYLSLVAAAQGSQINQSQRSITLWRQVCEFARTSGFSKRMQANTLVHAARAKVSGIVPRSDASGPCFPGLDEYQRALALYEQVPGSFAQREEILESILALVEDDALGSNSVESEDSSSYEIRTLYETTKGQNELMLQKINDRVNGGADPYRYQYPICHITSYWLHPARRDAVPFETAEKLAAFSTDPHMGVEVTKSLYGAMLKRGINPDSPAERVKLSLIAEGRGDKAAALLHLKAALAGFESKELRARYASLLANYFRPMDERQRLASLNGLPAARKLLKMHLQAYGPQSREVREDRLRLSRLLYAVGECAQCEAVLIESTGTTRAEEAMSVLLTAFKPEDAERLLNCVQRQGRLKETVTLANQILSEGASRIGLRYDWVRPVNTARSALINDAIARNDFDQARWQLRKWDEERSRALSESDTTAYGTQFFESNDLLFPIY